MSPEKAVREGARRTVSAEGVYISPTKNIRRGARRTASAEGGYASPGKSTQRGVRRSQSFDREVPVKTTRRSRRDASDHSESRITQESSYHESYHESEHSGKSLRGNFEESFESSMESFHGEAEPTGRTIRKTRRSSFVDPEAVEQAQPMQKPTRRTSMERRASTRELKRNKSLELAEIAEQRMLQKFAQGGGSPRRRARRASVREVEDDDEEEQTFTELEEGDLNDSDLCEYLEQSLDAAKIFAMEDSCDFDEDSPEQLKEIDRVKAPARRASRRTSARRPRNDQTSRRYAKAINARKQQSFRVKSEHTTETFQSSEDDFFQSSMQDDSPSDFFKAALSNNEDVDEEVTSTMTGSSRRTTNSTKSSSYQDPIEEESEIDRGLYASLLAPPLD
jgi:hypothetical protein